MVIDSSTVLAILQNEPERGAFNAAIASADHCALSAGLMAKGGSNNPCCSRVMISAIPISSQPAL